VCVCVHVYVCMCVCVCMCESAHLNKDNIGGLQGHLRTSAQRYSAVRLVRASQNEQEKARESETVLVSSS
jgi:hypothetical protein